jgi:hypothetical protein
MTKRTASAPPELLAFIFGELAKGPITREAVTNAVADAVRGRSLTATADACLRQAVGAALVAGRLLAASKVSKAGLNGRESTP